MGQSGRTYRFRRISEVSELTAHAGNFIRILSGCPRVATCGTCQSLLDLATIWTELSAEGAVVYVRLNVSRAIRAAEHDDLVAALNPADLRPETP